MCATVLLWHLHIVLLLSCGEASYCTVSRLLPTYNALVQMLIRSRNYPFA